MEESLGASGPRRRRIFWRKLSLELIVVFLGIIAGLFVNDWQLGRQDAQQEQQYQRAPQQPDPPSRLSMAASGRNAPHRVAVFPFPRPVN